MRQTIIAILFLGLTFFGLQGPVWAEPDAYTQGMSAFSDGAYTKSVRHFKDALKKYPDTAAYHYMLAMSYARGGKKLDAIPEFEKVIRLTDEPELLGKSYVNLLRALVDLEDYDEVERIGKQGQGASINDAEILNQIGRARLNHGKFDAAIDILTKATRVETGSWTIYNNLGLAYLKRANFKGAMHAFERAASLNARQPFVYNNLGVTYERLEEYGKAINAFTRALELDPGYSKARQSIQRNRKLKARAKAQNYAIEGKSP